MIKTLVETYQRDGALEQSNITISLLTLCHRHPSYQFSYHLSNPYFYSFLPLVFYSSSIREVKCEINLTFAN